MNDTDKQRLLKLCHSVKDELIVFDDKTAYTTTANLTVITNLSEQIYDSKIAVSPTTLASIINTLPDGDIKVRSLGDFKFQFKSKGYSRTITTVDAENSIKIEHLPIKDDIIITNGKKFYECMTFAMQFAHKNITQITSCVHISASGKEISFIGTDGVIMALRVYQQDSAMDEMKLSLTLDQCQSICRILQDDSVKAVRIGTDQLGKIVVVSKFGKAVLAKPIHEFKDFRKFLTKAPVNSETRARSAISNSASVESDELKIALSSIISMFVKNEIPEANLIIDSKSVIIKAEAVTRGYDKFSATINAIATGSLSVKISPILLLKSISKFKETVNIYWNPDLVDQSNNRSPICISGKDLRMDQLIYFNPINTVPKEED